jgi:hypothetical protein
MATPEDRSDSLSVFTRTWRISELEGAFRNLTAVVDSKVCYSLFIDGLDEFDGDKDDLIGTVKSLASMANVKMCIASKPWNVFESAFGTSLTDKLYLQDLNSDGIRKYVQDNLESLDEFQLLCSEGVQASDITQEIVYEAHGVFLWVSSLSALYEKAFETSTGSVIYETAYASFQRTWMPSSALCSTLWSLFIASQHLALSKSR